jgi:hypothetical protein
VTFYSRLEPYGDWVWLQGQYVWVPADVGPRWRPYTIGRWVFTDRYGWMWVSNEPFGWATYHYGRWGFSNRVGWFWVPGSRWAPAWVSWRRSDNYLAWAPLPPTPDEGLGISIRVGTIPDYYWQVVPDRDFLADDLPKRVVRDRDRYEPILRETQPIGNVTVVNNNVVVNNIIKVDYVEQKTNKKVVVHKVEKTMDEANSGKVDGAAVEVFQPAADQVPATAAPPKPKPIEVVAKKSETKEQAEGAASTDELLVPPEIKATPEAEAKPTAPPPPPIAEETKPGEVNDQPAPPPPPTEENVPASPNADEGGSPPPQEAPSPPTMEGQAPETGNGVPASTAVPEESAPPPPIAPTEESKGKKKREPKFKREKPQEGEMQSAPPSATENALPPPAAPVEEAAPVPPTENGAPPSPRRINAPTMRQDGGRKPKKERSEQMGPGESSPQAPPPSEESLPMPQQSIGGQPPANAGVKSKPKKSMGKAKQQCPEGMIPLEDGRCGRL